MCVYVCVLVLSGALSLYIIPNAPAFADKSEGGAWVGRVGRPGGSPGSGGSPCRPLAQVGRPGGSPACPGGSPGVILGGGPSLQKICFSK